MDIGLELALPSDPVPELMESTILAKPHCQERLHGASSNEGKVELIGDPSLKLSAKKFSFILSLSSPVL